jgi:hypothetical protein
VPSWPRDHVGPLRANVWPGWHQVLVPVRRLIPLGTPTNLLLALSLLSNVGVSYLLWKNWQMLKLLSCLVGGADLLTCR